MHEKVINQISELFGFDITIPDRRKKHVKARQATARLLYGKGGYSQTDIAKMLNCTRTGVCHGDARFTQDLKEGKEVAKECWDRVKDLL